MEIDTAKHKRYVKVDLETRLLKLLYSFFVDEGWESKVGNRKHVNEEIINL